MADEPPTRFRVAQIGVDHPHGAGWRESLANLPDELSLVALVPRFGGTLTSLEERNATLPRFQTVEDLLRWGQFDGALVSLSNDEAPQAVTLLANAGKHVLLEKPGAAGAAQAHDMVQAIEANSVCFQAGYMWRYDAGAQRLRQMVAEGRFGKLISVETSFVTSDAARRGPEHYLFDRTQSGAGFFNWLAVHWLDLLLHVTGQQVVSVMARVGVFGKTPLEVEDGGIAILELSQGTLATFLGGYWIPRWAGESQWCLRGSERWVHWSPSKAGTSGQLEIHGPQPQWHAMEETFTLPPDTLRGYGGRRALELIRDWVQSARAARPCRNTARSTLAVLELLDAIYRSSAEGRRIDVCIGEA